MAKVPDKYLYFNKQLPVSKVKRDEFESSNFVAKSPLKYKSRTVSKLESIDDDELDGGFPVIKASEGPIIVTFGGIQLVSGILMIAFGILAILHEASLSTVGAGLWGGAMGAANGVVGIIAGFKGCYQTSDRISPLAITVYLALCLVAIGVGILALVLTATGLLRDSHKSDYFLPLKQEDYKFVQFNDSMRTNWAPILANIGLLIITAVECLATLVAAFKCYWYVCGCRTRRPSLVNRSSGRNSSYRYDSPDLTTVSYCSSSRSKQKLVRCWLGQQQQPPPAHAPQPQPQPQQPHSLHSSRSSVPFAPPYGPLPPYYTIDGKTIYPSSSFVSYSDYNHMLPNVVEPYYPQWPGMSIFPQYGPSQSRPQLQERDGREIHPRSKHQYPSTKRYSNDERSRKKSDSTTISEREVDKSYTGLDREIAEEFISAAMQLKP